jgi:endonuclease/exonuclease/phosphatase family metal-dependent hydrolase
MATEPAEAPCRQVARPSSLAVAWVGPEASRDRDRLDRWCDAVGPLVADPTPRAAPIPDNTIAVVVWNVHVGGGDVGQLIDALTRGEFTDGAPVTSFVLLLQETYRRGDEVPAPAPRGSGGPRMIRARPPSGPRRSALDVARERGLAIVYAPSMRNAKISDTAHSVEDRGNAIVSTWPIADAVAIELPFERQRRVAVAATIQGRTPAGAPWQLRVADAHLDTSVALTRGGPLAARRRQAAALVQALGSSQLPTVLGGDFNTWLGSHEPAVGALRRAFSETPAQATAATWRGPLGVRGVLDRVFVKNVSGRMSVRRLAGRFGSDHYPILLVVSVSPTPVR